QLFEGRVDPAAVDEQLAHVADVEQARFLAGPQVLGDDSLVLDRHRVAGERNHPAAAGAVPGIERKLAESLAWVGLAAHSDTLRQKVRPQAPVLEVLVPPPSVPSA